MSGLRMRPARASIAAGALVVVIFAALASCGPSSGDAPADMQDLQAWLAAIRRQSATGAALPSDRQGRDREPPQSVARPGALVAQRDPFAAPIAKPAKPTETPEPTGTQRPDAGEPAALHMLGTLRSGGRAYALIKADHQVFCVAANESLPSYPVTVTGVTDHAVGLEHRLPDGGRRKSTLRLGE
jgi:Tfp pilus assembly protein PilP